MNPQDQVLLYGIRPHNSNIIDDELDDLAFLQLD